MIMNTWKVCAMAALSTSLIACGGEDGSSGHQGLQGEQGLPGQAPAPAPGAPTGKAIDLTILHMNDHHSHIAAETFDFDVTDLGLTTQLEDNSAVSSVEVTYGGFPMMVSLFNTLTAQSDNVLKLHSGDAVTGTLYNSLFKGRADAEMMNQICFDAFALGNHEFDEGDRGLANFLDSLNSTACETAVLAANVIPGENSAVKTGYLQPYTIVMREGEKIGIIGIDIAGKTKNSSSPDEDTQFLDETITAQKYIDELTSMDINKIVLVTHYQYENDLTLAAALTGVDVIVGGDSHTLLGDSTFSDLGFNPVAPYPTVVTDNTGSTVCVVHAWEYSHLLGKLDVSFDEQGKVTECAGNPVMPISNVFEYEHQDDEMRTLKGNDLTSIVAALTAEDEIVIAQDDSTTAALLAIYNEDVDILKETVIGSNATDLCLSRVPGDQRSSLCDSSATFERGSDISNVVAKAFLKVSPTADIAIQNGGGVRIDLPAGDITIADAFTLLPFSNTLVILDMSGQQIINVLEDALANFIDNGGSNGSYPYAAGLRYQVDASQSKGSRISEVTVNPQVDGDWAAINTTTIYRVVTNNFIASGRDGYTTFSEPYEAGEFEDTFTEYAQGFINYAANLNSESQQVDKLPVEEYSTQLFIDTDNCNHTTEAGCTAP
jgi:5'-nucleotidase/UDP-sugar diphosphatase